MARRTRAPQLEVSPRARTARGPIGATGRAKRSGSSRGASARGSRNASARGCLFWIVLLAVVVAVGFAAREPLMQAYRSLAARRRAAEAAPRQQHEVPAPKAPAAVAPQSPAAKPQPAAPAAPAARPAAKPAPQPPSSAPPAPSRPGPAARPLRKARLFFLAPGQDGTAAVTPVAVDRSIPQSDSPLRDALEALLAGPDASDRARGLWTGIPPETRLRSVVVRDGIAFVDLSESFRFTAGGVEGLAAELDQVVSTAAQFPTVQKVQILIEGRRVRYLGTEGVRIDEPLTP